MHWFVEHPQTLRPKNIKSVAMTTVVPRYPLRTDQL